jgi:hypothetical protein
LPGAERCGDSGSLDHFLSSEEIIALRVLGFAPWESKIANPKS